MKIGFVGFGHMAQVLFKAITLAKLAPKSKILFTRQDQGKAAENEQEFGISSTSLSNLVKESDLILLCVKPQQATKVLSELKTCGMDGKAVVSILAGTRISTLETCGATIVRAMPNLCTSVGEGMTVICHSAHCDKPLKDFVNELFGAMGEVVTIEEKLMDISTAMAGCGPGFVFRLIHAMAKSGEKHGMEKSCALKIAAQTFLGAAKVIQEGGNPEELVIQIATPNGATQAGFESMDRTDVEGHLQAAIAAAAQRSAEL